MRRRIERTPQTYADVTGELVAVDDEKLVVRADTDGALHTVARRDVVAAKQVPPRPPRYSEIAELERIAAAAWPAPVLEPLGDWYLRAAEGWTSRANSALPVGDPGVPLDEAVQMCVRWYQARDLTPRISVPLPLRRDLERLLAQLGWSAQSTVLVQTAPVRPAPPGVTAQSPPTPPNRSSDVELLERPSKDFLRIVQARKSGLPAAAHHVLLGVPKVGFAEIRDSAELLAIARGAVVEGWLYLALVEVVESARRRGLGERISRALVEWGAEQGATNALLHVEATNTPALNLYARLGFRTHHRYVTFAYPRAGRRGLVA